MAGLDADTRAAVMAERLAQGMELGPEAPGAGGAGSDAEEGGDGEDGEDLQQVGWCGLVGWGADGWLWGTGADGGRGNYDGTGRACGRWLVGARCEGAGGGGGGGVGWKRHEGGTGVGLQDRGGSNGAGVCGGAFGRGNCRPAESVRPRSGCCLLGPPSCGPYRSLHASARVFGVCPANRPNSRMPGFALVCSVQLVGDDPSRFEDDDDQDEAMGQR